MVQTNNLNVLEVSPIIAPMELKQVFPLPLAGASFVNDSRNTIKSILKGEDKRLLAVVGPCSIHDPIAALEYARKLAHLAEELKDQLFIIMRVYFEKPRTTIGWKGLINDPDMDGTHLISKGLGIARQLFCAITEMRLPIGSEMLDPITPQYLSDIISWGAIGARTTESQTHREMASGLSFPVGFKNGTDGGLKIAMDAIAAACREHSFLGINKDGHSSIVHTAGNPDVHLVLRGGDNAPNYYPKDVQRAARLLSKKALPTSIMVDCSHANSYKDHDRQSEVLDNVVDQLIADPGSITGVMIESNIHAGNQSIPEDLRDLKYGVSITDKCVSWETTVEMLTKAHDRLAGR
ncbi:3-deoxy-D-arabinoheptulosonate-7-phosphate synthase [Desulfuromusa kysingii]|uniref:Phospho-2-dehydro-3-deoxyheptonate aldolase n=1 Tax=Desulfuromusa kysingii TaxID=37625 RepID=A0A1H3YQ26_9BACT|nr:3-deoxy-7-phosphoheptulonate synthase [Desulfuromusa kysingii]SEA13134.1 3-deoxy-D-arabinoheptulosonate-7-phosphate synthase [Desulfuromusa kysingii]